MKNRYCRNCGRTFQAERSDAKFCGAACTADYTRRNGEYRERFHAEKQEDNAFNCEHCGKMFWVNDYALRGGARRPKFCSAACRKAAWRKKGTSNPTPKTAPKKQVKNDVPKLDLRWQSKDPFVVLGINGRMTYTEQKRQYIELIKSYHPDVYKGLFATEISQAVNAAWGKIKR